MGVPEKDKLTKVMFDVVCITGKPKAVNNVLSIFNVFEVVRFASVMYKK